MSILLAIATFVLILTSVFLILLVLAQKAKSDGGMGAAMGGGMAEATFGADTGNVLSKATINAAIVFFVLSFCAVPGQDLRAQARGCGGRLDPADDRRSRVARATEGAGRHRGPSLRRPDPVPGDQAVTGS